MLIQVRFDMGHWHGLEYCVARGVFDGRRLVVKKGSEVPPNGEASSMRPPERKLRARLINENILVKPPDDSRPWVGYIFAKDHDFKLAYLAASVIQGCHTDGFTDWREDKNGGKSLKELGFPKLNVTLQANGD